MLRAEGRYTGSIIEAVTSENNGKDQMVIDFALEEGGNARVYLFMTDAAWPYTEDKLKRLGFNGNFESPEFANGSSVSLTCRVENYEGKDREKWDLGGGMPAPSTPDKLRRLSAKWRASVGTVAQPAGRPSTPPATAPKAAPPPAAEPPEAEETAAEKTFGIKTKEEAWEAWCSANNDNPDVARWKKVIGEVEKKSGKKEARFGPDEWDAVADKAVPI